jgi:hypothetical protein
MRIYSGKPGGVCQLDITCWRVLQGVSVVSCFPVYIYSHCLYSTQQLISSEHLTLVPALILVLACELVEAQNLARARILPPPYELLLALILVAAQIPVLSYP